MFIAFLRYWFKAGNRHSIHSPFVYDLYNSVIKSDLRPSGAREIESLRKNLKKDDRLINIRDFGAGSRKDGNKQRKISSIIRSAEKSPRWGILFYHLIRKFNFTEILDLGTSFGLTTAYEACANPESRVTSFEGCPETAAIARENFERLKLKNVEVVVGNIDETLPRILADKKTVDFVFFDANHRYEPTMRYFGICLEKKHEYSCFVFDDIYWSDEMKQAWHDIRQHEEVTLTIDLFFVGLVFFRKTQAREHFILR